jgi:D-threonate/D-erythronate kinase
VILALADDMTGALEIGAKFSGAGIETIVSAIPVLAVTAPVVVLDTETRHVDAETARREIFRFVAAAGPFTPRLIFKKTDSTLRGNIGAELQALAELYPQWSIGYAPAYPAMGRTVRSGVLYVHGREVALTEFASDELNPIACSSIAALLDAQLPCRVFDGETDDHLAEAARAILSDDGMRIAAGPAGLAEMIASAVDLPRRGRAMQPRVRSCLVMNGSRHERSANQVRNATALGWRALSMVHEPGLNPLEIASAHARYLVEQTALDVPDAIVVIGGDTAFAVVRALQFPALEPIAEVVPGVPVTRIAAADLQNAIPGRGRDLILITKAGGFGEDDVLARVRSKLSDD